MDTMWKINSGHFKSKYSNFLMHEYFSLFTEQKMNKWNEYVENFWKMLQKTIFSVSKRKFRTENRAMTLYMISKLKYG